MINKYKKLKYLRYTFIYAKVVYASLLIIKLNHIQVKESIFVNFYELIIIQWCVNSLGQVQF